jgi:hypothetical protein
MAKFDTQVQGFCKGWWWFCVFHEFMLIADLYFLNSSFWLHK